MEISMADLNIVLNKPATASSYVMPYVPSRAVNGTITSFSRWLCNTVPANLTVDLGSVNVITSWAVKHMGVAGWPAPNYNMTDYALQGSINNTNWVTLDTVSGNSASTTIRSILCAYRYVRVYVTGGIRTNPQLASLMEFEVYGHQPTAYLSALTISSGALAPVFTPLTLAYTAANVPYSTSNVAITATAVDPTSTIKVNGTVVTSGQSSSVNLNVGSNTINVLVTALDGTTTKTYTVTVVREAGACLSDLIVRMGMTKLTLTPTFDRTTFLYSTSVSGGTKNVKVTATLDDRSATIMINGESATSGVALTVPTAIIGINPINVVVTAGTDTKTYVVNVTRPS